MKNKRLFKRTFAVLSVLLITASFVNLFFLKPKSAFADSTFSLNEGYGTVVSDSTGNISGTITNAVWKQEDLCKVGKCLYFDGIGDLVSFADNSNLDFGASNAFTLEGWFRTPDITSGQRTVIAKHNATAGGYKVYMDSNGYLIFGIDDDSTWTPDDTASTTATAFDDNRWHFFSAVKTETSITIYVDGVQYQTDSSLTATGSLANANSFYVGIDGNGTSNGFSGFLDEIRILKSPKTTAEIKTDYAGQSKTITGAGPVGWWKMDETSGTNAYDSSGNENTGTWNGNTTTVAGKIGTGYAFDGTGDYVNAGSSTTVDNLQALTVSTWIYANADSGRIIDKQTNLNAAGWQIELKNTGSDVQFIVDYDGAADLQVEANTNLVTATWYHVVVTWDGTANASGVKIYINGALQTDLTNNISGVGSKVDDSSQSIGLSCRAADATQCTSGRLDDLRLYNYARSGSQILEDMQGYLPAGTAASFEPDNSHLSDGLVGYWKMDETSWTNNCSTGTVLDSSGNANNAASCPNTTGPTGGSVGKYGNSGTFDGADDYLESTSTSLLLANSVTVSSWIYITSAGTTARKYIVNTTNSNQGYALTQTDTTPTMKFSIGDGSSYVYANGATTLSTGTWYHVVGTADSEGNVKVYVNGVLDGENTATGPMQLPSGINFRIGARSTSNYFNGKIDETRIYNRALSPAEVRSLYSAAPGPVGYWKLDENTGTTANDSSGNGFTGTATNGPIWEIGKVGKSLGFDGVNDYVDVGDVFYSDSMTIEAWVNVSAVDVATHKNIVIKRNGSGVTAGNNEFELTVGSTRSIFWNAWDAGGTGISSMSSTTPLELNRWYHVAVSYNGFSGTSYMYVNGLIEDTDVATGVLGDTTSRLQFGARSGSNDSRYFNGFMDSIMIYNYPRTVSQIFEDMNNGRLDPVSYWKFDEGSGTTAKNTVAGNNNLTLSAASWSNSGKFGKSWDGDGARWVSIADADTAGKFDFAAVDDFSISMWIKSDSTVNPVATEYLLSKAEAGAGYRLYVQNDGSGSVSFGIDDDVTWTPGDSVNSGVDIYDTNWHHIVATKFGTSKIQLYVDGQLKQEDTSIVETGTLENATTLYLGDRNGANGGDEFFGDLDDVQIFRGALSSEQVKVLYNGSAQSLLGSVSVSSAGVVDRSSAGEYCVPGDTTSCLPPVAHWKMDENIGTTAKDTSGNGYDGTLTNGPTWVAGKFGRGVNTNSASTYINVADAGSGDLDFNASDNFTISAWIKTTDDSGISREFLYKGFGGSDPGYRFRLATDDNFVCGIADNAAGTNETGTSGLPLNDGIWHNVVCVMSSNTVTVYVDGVMRATESEGTETGSLESARALQIGRNSATAFWPGSLDDVRIYRYARSAAQLAWDYNQGKPAAWWKMDECSGTALNDSMGVIAAGTIAPGASGNTAVGTCGSGTATEMWNDGTIGKYSGSLGFDGGDDAVSVPNSAAINFNGMAGITMSAWIKPTSAGETSRGRVVDKDGAINGYQMYVTETGNVGFAIDTATGDYLEAKTTSGLLTFNTWHSVVTTYNAADSSYVVYIDGQSQPTAIDHTGSGTIVDNGGSLYIGNRVAGDRTFDGQIDDVRIYNYPLTESQVKTVVNEGSAVRFGQ